MAFLGQADKEIWTLEGSIVDDAKGDFFFNFVRTLSNGIRYEKKLLLVDDESDTFKSEDLNKKLLDKLWSLTNKLNDL